MGLAQLVKEPELNERQSRLRSQFLEATGYGRSDILSCNYQTQEFLTRNGGRYQVDADGTITHLAGPTADQWDRL